jgi:hypothetical protein
MNIEPHHPVHIVLLQESVLNPVICITQYFVKVLNPVLFLTPYFLKILNPDLSDTPYFLKILIHSSPLKLNWYSGGWSQLSPLGTAITNRPIVPAPGSYDNGKFSGLIGRVNRCTRRKPAPMPLCPPQTPHAVRTRTRAATVGSQRLTTWATARPLLCITLCFLKILNPVFSITHYFLNIQLQLGIKSDYCTRFWNMFSFSVNFSTIKYVSRNNIT